MYKPILFFTVIMYLSFTSCKEATNTVIESDTEPSAFSLTGDPLFPLKHSETTFKIRDSLLQIAKSNYEEDPQNLQNIIWYGRRLAYLDKYTEAISVFTLGMESHPEAPELFRHRGHRFITTRNFDNAIEDLLSAAEFAKGRDIEIEPDGLPNKLNIPLSNLHFNIYYHLGLAHFLKGNFELAQKAYQECMKYSDNPDLEIATSDWLYMTYRRLEKDEEAKSFLDSIPEDYELVENDGYYDRIKMYKGLIPPEDLVSLEGDIDNLLQLVTQGYGVAHHYLVSGEEDKYLDLLNKIINTGYWPAFGYIAAEADLFRMNQLED